nr:MULTISPECIES: hypothetical protein [Pseudomonas]
MSNLSLSEDDVRQALGLTPAAPKKQKKEKSTNPFTYTLVELSVRKNGGPPFRFEHRSRSISRLTAQLEAEKAARAQGLDVWVLLDIRQESK